MCNKFDFNMFTHYYSSLEVICFKEERPHSDNYVEVWWSQLGIQKYGPEGDINMKTHVNVHFYQKEGEVESLTIGNRKLTYNSVLNRFIITNDLCDPINIRISLDNIIESISNILTEFITPQHYT